MDALVLDGRSQLRDPDNRKRFDEVPGGATIAIPTKFTPGYRFPRPFAGSVRVLAGLGFGRP